MSNILIRIKNVKKRYGKGSEAVEALKGVSIDIFKGEIIGLLGVNGAGKTTLSSIIATLHPASEGDIEFNDKSIYADVCDFRRIIGFCPQKPNLNPMLSIEQNLIFAGRYYGMSEADIQARKDDLMEKYELKKYATFMPHALSGGYKQRAMIARALMHSPKLVILDEPTVGLDPHIRHQLWENIKNLKKEGVTVILTTHYLDEAETLSDRICIMDKGNIKLIDTPENLMRAHQKSNLEEVFIQLMKEETAV